MAKLTWLGEDTEDGPGPSFVIAYDGIKFPKGHPVEVMDKGFIAKAKGNQFFEVDDSDEFVPSHPEPRRRGRPPKVKEEESADV